jgi:hypothetical protein
VKNEEDRTEGRPGIKIVFSPSAPAEYNAMPNSKLTAGSVGNMITCRPFDASLKLYNQGNLAGGGRRNGYGLAIWPESASGRRQSDAEFSRGQRLAFDSEGRRIKA